MLASANLVGTKNNQNIVLSPSPQWERQKKTQKVIQGNGNETTKKRREKKNHEKKEENNNRIVNPTTTRVAVVKPGDTVTRCIGSHETRRNTGRRGRLVGSNQIMHSYFY